MLGRLLTIRRVALEAIGRLPGFGPCPACTKVLWPWQESIEWGGRHHHDGCVAYRGRVRL